MDWDALNGVIAWCALVIAAIAAVWAARSAKAAERAAEAAERQADAAEEAAELGRSRDALSQAKKVLISMNWADGLLNVRVTNQSEQPVRDVTLVDVVDKDLTLTWRQVTEQKVFETLGADDHAVFAGELLDANGVRQRGRDLTPTYTFVDSVAGRRWQRSHNAYSPRPMGE